MNDPSRERFFSSLAKSGRELVLRVDDVGIHAAEESTLIGETAAMGHAVNAAVVPTHASSTTGWLPRLAAKFPGIEIHQHGWSHTNYESTERKGEFGSARPLEERTREIGQGKALLEQRFGPSFVAVFCPPWNRLSRDVIDICHALSFAGVSAFREVALPPPMRNLSANIDVTKVVRMGTSPEDGLLAATATVLSRSQGPRLMIHPHDLTEGETGAVLGFLARALSFGIRAVPFSSLLQQSRA
jgi:hypothetical protein